MLLAQISDLHLTAPGTLAYGRIDTAAHLARCVDTLNTLDRRPDAVLITGDLANDGHPDAYRHLRALLAPLAMPWYPMVGNHDDRDALRAVFPERKELSAGGEFIQYAFDIEGVRVIALDTMNPGNDAGRLCDARLAWLAEELDRARAMPVLIALHHPPFATGIRFMDDVRLDPADSARLESLVRAHPNVERVLCGHMHRTIVARFGGTIAWCAPSTAHQVALELRDDGPAAYVMEPPGFALHLHTQERGLVTHYLSVDQGDGPRRFDEQD
jgi:3',5'-cyclic AMP phosphodiesterase CpdA